MSLIKLIFSFEWRQFVRQPAQLLILIFFLLMGFYSLSIGHRFVGRQLEGLDTLQKNQQLNLRELTDRFNADTSTAKGKMLAEQAGLPQVIEYRASPLATNPPRGLAVMAIGQRDILPYFDIINSKRDVLTPPNAEIANPEKLASGNFDFSFVLIYLFPLLIIILCYDLFAKEKEQQTDRLLNVQSGDLNQILLYKLLFRLLLVSGLSWILSAIGVLIRPAATALSAIDVVLWFFVLNAYLLFWFSICWLVVVFRKSSRINALVLLGIWLLLTLVLPALMNKLAALKYPMPLRTELVAHQRETMLDTWEMPIKELLIEFYRNHPEYRSLRRTDDTAQYGNKRFMAYYDLLGRRMNENVKAYQAAAQKHNAWLSKTAWLNPVAQMQSLLNATAGTGLNDYLFYQNQAGLFQNKWSKLMNSYLLVNKKLSRTEVLNLPVFKPEKEEHRAARIFGNALSIWLALVLILWISSKRKLIKTKNS